MKVFALAFMLFASTPIVLDTTNLAENEVVMRREGNRTVLVSRKDETVTVRIDEGKRVDTVTISAGSDGKLSISHTDNGEPREILALDRRPVIVDGIDLEPFLAGNLLGDQHNPQYEIPAPDSRFQRSGPRFYLCPKDETMVRVPAGRAPAELKCPLDGTTMRAGTGRDSQIFLLD